VYLTNDGKGDEMNIAFKIVTVLAFVASCLWVYFDLKFDSVFAFLIALSALIALFVVPKIKRKTPNLSQNVSNHSEGIQAGRDVNIKR
jgi:membrane protein YdbS with pleckstrin-like domain